VGVELEFCLLGPLAVRRDGAVVPVSGSKQRALLAALLLNAGRTMTTDELAEALWGTRPPPSARASLQTYVMRLRKSLGDADRSRIVAESHGYRIRVAPGELDVDRFAADLAAARDAIRAAAWPDAAARLRAALALWRGQPLADVASPALALREAPRLVEMRLQALEARIDADLHLGEHTEVIVELRQLTAAHPLRERLHGLLMIALHRAGQRADALAAYQAARRAMIAELGAEPGRELRELQRQVLAADPALAAEGARAAEPRAAELRAAEPGGAEPGGSELGGAELGGAEPRSAESAGGGAGAADAEPGGGPESGWTVPRQLPATVPHFAGRGAELEALAGLVGPAGPAATGPGTVLISAIGGTAGVGKTALAVRWARQVAGRFPDGQLYVNLRGYDSDQPVTAADALAGFLRALGVPGPDIPAPEAEQSARYRRLLAGRRVLVVLDNAGSVAQVRPLLPGSPTCLTVVTSRDALAGLIARDGTHRVELDRLPLPEAVSLLRALIGPRVDADPAAAATLARQCARLPLALRVAAELAATRPDVALAGLAAELADQQRRLDLLDAGGDARTAIRAVFSWSHRGLAAPAARMFRLLGLHPGPDLGEEAAAALAGADPKRARAILATLARAHLIEVTGARRYGLHDLLRAYATELAGGQDSEAERRAALSRLLDYYLHSAAAAMDELFPAERHRRPGLPAPAAAVAPGRARDHAQAWLDDERAALVAVTGYAAEHGWPGHATRLAATLFRYLDAGGHLPEAAVIHGHARRAARLAGDPAAEAAALTSLGTVSMRQGRHPEARGHLEQALTLYRTAGDQPGQARALQNLALTELEQGRYPQAAGFLEQALAGYRETGDRTGQARALLNLGLTQLRMSRYPEAVSRLEQARALFRATGDRPGEAHVLGNLGGVHLWAGRYPQAAEILEQAIGLCQATGYLSGVAYLQADLGYACLYQGQYPTAAGHLEQALAMCRETGERTGEARALNGLGEIFRRTGQPGAARQTFTAALGLAAETGDLLIEAMAHEGLAEGFEADGADGPARRHWAEAHSRYVALGNPQAGQVADRLAAPSRSARPARLPGSDPTGGADHDDRHGHGDGTARDSAAHGDAAHADAGHRDAGHGDAAHGG
jgi:DNA-binding SARP family transcriptional activator/tetratricopeptide (TPR) repeat protein